MVSVCPPRDKFGSLALCASPLSMLGDSKVSKMWSLTRYGSRHLQSHSTQGDEAKLQEFEATLGYIAKWKPAWTSLKEKEKWGWGPLPWRGTSGRKGCR